MIDIKEQALQMQRPKKQHRILLGGLKYPFRGARNAEMQEYQLTVV